MRNKVFCIECGDLRGFRIRAYLKTYIHKDVTFRYIEHAALCEACGKRVYIPEVNDMNVDAIEKEYFKEKVKQIICEEDV